MTHPTPQPTGLQSARRRTSAAAVTADAVTVGTDASAPAAGGPTTLARGVFWRTGDRPAAPAARGVFWNAARGKASAALLGITASLALPALAGPAYAAPAPVVVEQGVATYIVRAPQGGLTALVARLEQLGTVTRQVPLINGAVAELSAPAARQLAGDRRVLSVSADMSVGTLSYDAKADPRSEFNQQASANVRAVWGDATTKGFTGAGVDVAVLDTGVSPVEGLTGLSGDGRSKLVHGPDLSFDSQIADKTNKDLFGHGTAMAAIIAGRDTGAQPKTKKDDANPYLGVAPDARIVSVKVGDSRGAVDVSQVIAGIDWVVQNAKTNGMNIRVLNLSLGYPSTQDHKLDPLSYAAEQAWKRGIVVVASAGNDGTGTGRLMTPAVNPFVVAVGAADTMGTAVPDDDVIPDFSTRGTLARTPDVVAPGRSVQTIVPADSHAALGNADKVLAGRFLRGSGTSEAAAQVSGAVALLLEKHPTLSPDQVKSMLRSTSTFLKSADREAQGKGLLHAAKLLSASIPTTSAQKVPQDHNPATGTGSLDAARGGLHLADANTGVVLDGERDIMGNAYDSAKQAQLQATASSWSNGTWNGATWSGATWRGDTWTGATWSGATWSGATWRSDAWAGATWRGATWSGATWRGDSWAGATWRTAFWQGTSWA